MTKTNDGKPAPHAARSGISKLSARQAQLVDASKELASRVDAMRFGPPVTHVYNPLRYAWNPHREYLSRCRVESTEVLFLGMNPGPWGMAQTGVPFGQIDVVRDWLQINEPIDPPKDQHPKRPIEGFECRRSEVSGQRLWGLFKNRFGSSAAFFEHHFVANYCPLVFMEASGKNRTPDKLSAAEMKSLQAACDDHLQRFIALLCPRYLVGVGAYAETCLKRVVGTLEPSLQNAVKVLRVLHPSPASPAANRDWAKIATAQLVDAGVWQTT